MDIRHELKRFDAWLRTKASPTIRYDTLADLILDAGWTGEDAVTAFAVVGGESGFKIDGTNINKTGTGDYGLFQINDIHHPTEEEKFVPAANVKKAHSVWEGRKRWDPDPFKAWMAYANRDRSESSKASWEEFIALGRQYISEAEARRQ